MRSILSVFLVTGVFLSVASSAQAGSINLRAPNGPGGGPNGDPVVQTPCSTSDVLFGGSIADACQGPITNPQNDFVGGSDPWAVNSIPVLGGEWEAFLRDTGTPSTSYFGLTWTLDAELGETSGDWTLTVTDGVPSRLPFTVDLMVVLKAGAGWSAYRFDQVLFANPSDLDGAGEFTMAIRNNGGSVAELSHMSLYLRDAARQDCSLTDPQCGGGGDDVPEPTTMILLGLGLLSGGYVARRRRA